MIKQIILKAAKLLIGLFISALGVITMINGNIGLPPWDVLHKGISNVLGITMGQSVIIMSIVLILIGLTLGQKIGLGTLGNMLFVGIFMDIIVSIDLIPQANSWGVGFIMMNIGMFLLALGSVLYISCELGCGSKDSVTLGLTSKLNQPVKYVRAGLEIIAVIAGLILGSTFTIVTVYSALTFGYIMQLTFKLLKCNAAELQHVSIMDYVRRFRERNIEVIEMTKEEFEDNI